MSGMIAISGVTLARAAVVGFHLQRMRRLLLVGGMKRYARV